MLPAMDSALATLPVETLQARLAEALDAQHALNIGRRVAMATTATGQRVQYAESQAGELRAYIAALQSAIAAKTAGRPVRGPIYLVF